MKKYMLKFLTAVIIVNVTSCGNSQQNSHTDSKIDTTTNQTLTNKYDYSKNNTLPLG